ncbi:hypothetical protein FYK55_11965 [Roseiconus nitratireducens]|uniref:Uncharacterized protein n=1 Tax=Roseiconus nitratireducens TaxID=2605748 RepID=A0A5M6DBK0_9BACT|nr:hypothetical protein [Roseiconus nitratireducens]KAA5543876.1 hypothetical protein FYK55_11965 [Roseiconus nitratireducens]
MNRHFKRVVAFATVAAVSVQAVPQADACGRGGRVVRSSGYGYRAPVYSQPARYVQPTYSQPSYSQPAYAQPNYGQPTLGQPSQTQPGVVRSAPAPTRQPQPAAAGIARSANVNPTTQIQSQTTAPASKPGPTKTAATASGLATNTSVDAETSALAALASLAAQSNASQPSTTQSAEPQATSAQPVTTPVETSADAAMHVGRWQAKLPSDVTVSLELAAGGTFAWVVQKDGKTTSFSGQYRITDGRLTLVRSNDLQKMAGSWTEGKNGFTFKLDGANNSGLQFSKA